MQYEISLDWETNFRKVEENAAALMGGMNKPEMIMGPELALGKNVRLDEKLIDKLAAIARRYKIYFLPGSVLEDGMKDGEPVIYNALPIFGPDGALIDIYRKICPYYPVESDVTPGDRPVVFEIKEKKIKVGVRICHDWGFPEISRNLTLMGAELLFRPAVDPEGLYQSYHYVPSVRALENQAYFISLNCCGKSLGESAYGHTVIANPEGGIVYEAENAEVNLCVTLDFNLVERTRRYGTFFTDQLLRQLKLFRFPAPFERMEDAPLLKELPDPDRSVAERLDRVASAGLNELLGKA
jgi:predicted amidohydrolase